MELGADLDLLRCIFFYFLPHAVCFRVDRRAKHFAE